MRRSATRSPRGRPGRDQEELRVGAGPSPHAGLATVTASCTSLTPGCPTQPSPARAPTASVATIARAGNLPEAAEDKPENRTKDALAAERIRYSSSPASPALMTMSMSSAPDERPRVLIVDDEKFIRDILADFLGMEGYVVRTAEDGAAALTELGNAHYDLIISDLKMPRMGGIELLEAIGDAAPQRAHRHHDRLRHRRDRDRRDEARRVRLHPQAVQGGGGHPRRAARAREAAPGGREPAPARGAVALQGERGDRREPVARGGARDRRRHGASTRSTATSSPRGSTTARAATSSASASCSRAERLVAAAAVERASSCPPGARHASRPTPRATPRVGSSTACSRRRPSSTTSRRTRRCSSRAARARASSRRRRRRRSASLVAVPAAHEDAPARLDRASRASPKQKRFDEGQRKLLRIVGSRAAAAIENARLYEDLRATFQQTIQGLAQRDRQDGPLHRRPLRARRHLRDVPRRAPRACRRTWSRSCARAR